MENITIVFFDISDDKIRNKTGEICKDFGLVRFQNSGFIGRLSLNKREELYIKLTNLIADKSAKVLIQSVCEKCFDNALVIGDFKTEDEVPEKEIPDIWSLPSNYPVTED